MGKARTERAPDPHSSSVSDNWLAPIGMALVVVALVLILIVGLPMYFIGQSDRAEQLREQTAPFHVGDIVRARIGKFRGTVIDVYCGVSCNYWVRFDTISMEPQRMKPYEIEHG